VQGRCDSAVFRAIAKLKKDAWRGRHWGAYACAKMKVFANARRDEFVLHCIKLADRKCSMQLNNNKKLMPIKLCKLFVVLSCLKLHKTILNTF
jgi:hypothetical protein